MLLTVLDIVVQDEHDNISMATTNNTIDLLILISPPGGP